MKCSRCSSEWNSTVKSELCPFCGEKLELYKQDLRTIEDVFSFVFSEYGIEIINEHRRFAAVLGDYAPQMNNERNLIKIAMESGAYASLIEANDKNFDEQQICFRKVQAMLEQKYFLSSDWVQKVLIWLTNYLGWNTNYVYEEKENEKKCILTRNNQFEKVLNSKIRKRTKQILSSASCTVGLKSDGTLLITKSKKVDRFTVTNWYGIKNWYDLVSVQEGYYYFVGLKTDGTVLIAGESGSVEQKMCSNWSDIISISAGQNHVVGLKSNGRVVAAGGNEYGQCNVNDWKDIVCISAGTYHTVGLKSDGTVVMVGYEYNRIQGSYRYWNDIIDISATYGMTVGLKSDGTVVVCGREDYEQQIRKWNNICSVSASGHIVGLKTDGTVMAIGRNDCGQCNVDSWTDIVAVVAGSCCTIGLRKDGKLVAVGNNKMGQCDVFDWQLFDDFYNIEQECIKKTQEKNVEKIKEIENWKMNGLCQYCGGAFKGLFTKKCSVCNKEKDY